MPVEPHVTGPSNNPGDPVITAGPVATPTIRTGLQAGAGFVLMQGVDLFFPALTTPEQEAWLALVLTPALAWVQNVVEAWRGRRLVGTAT